MPYTDGNFPSGAGTLTVNSITYKCNNFSSSDTASATNVNDENGDHAGAIVNKGPITFDAEIQVQNANVAIPTSCAHDATTGIATRDNITYMIITATKPKQAQGAWVVQLSGQKKANA